MKKVQIVMIILLIFLSTAYQAATEKNEASSSKFFKWIFKTKGQINASALIYDDILYMGSFDSCFYAIDAKTGIEKWHYKTQNRIYTTAVKYNDVLCFESGNVLYALNLLGELEWQFTLYDGQCVNQHDDWDFYHSSPMLIDSIVYIGSEKGKVYGINILTGNKVFECQTPSANFTIETTPAIYDNKIYFGDWDGVFFAYDLSTAQMVWNYDTKKDKTFSSWVNAIVTDPVIVNGKVFFGGRSCALYCLDAGTGNKEWRTPDPGGDMWTIGGPTYMDGVLYMGSSNQFEARAFSATTGKVIWKTNVGNRLNDKPYLDGNYVIVGTESSEGTKEGSFIFLNKSNGKIVSQINFSCQIYSSPILHDSTFYFGGTNGNIYAVNYSSMANVPLLTTKVSNLQCGDRENTASFDTTTYFYNKGTSTDSISIISSMKEVSVEPSNFYLAAHDSQQVKITVNPTALTAKSYSCTISAKSNWAVPAVTIDSYVKFKIEVKTDVSKQDQTIRYYNLEQNFPNPFNPSTVISYQLPELSKVKLKIYNIMGKEVASLVDKEQNTGMYNVTFDGKDLSSGIYFYKIEAGKYVKTQKMLLLK